MREMYPTRILSADDDQIAQFLIEEMLNAYCPGRHEFLKAENGLHALEHLRDAHKMGAFPDVLLVDLDMPGMNGWEFIKAYEKEWLSLYPQTRLYVLSSSIATTDRSRSEEKASVTGFISKPVPSEFLVGLVA